MGADDYGIWVQVQATTVLVMSFVNLGFPIAMSRFLATRRDRSEVQDDFWSAVSLVSLVTLAVSVIFIAGADFIARAFFDGFTNIVRITGLIILIWTLNTVFLNLFEIKNTKFALSMCSTSANWMMIFCLNGYDIVVWCFRYWP
jgi:O-antigen/teichoic acid export membrane protein